MKIISFSQQGPRAICILSANGVISSVTLRQPDSSGGTLTYEVCFLSIDGFNTFCFSPQMVILKLFLEELTTALNYLSF